MGLGTKKESAWFFFYTPSYSPILYSILLLLRILNPLIISRTKREGLSSMWIMTSKQNKNPFRYQTLNSRNIQIME